MVVTIYTEEDGKHTYFGIKEFTVVGAMSIVGTDEVDFGKQGFRFEDNAENKSDHKEKQSADID